MHPLSYAAPGIFLQAKFRWRTWWTLLCIIMGSGLTLGCGALAFWGNFARGTLFIQLISGLIAVATLVGLVWLVLAYVGGREDAMLITQDGITRNRRLWQWNCIRRLEANFHTNGLWIHFYTSLGGLPFPHVIQTTPPLTSEQYAQLARLLIDNVVPLHPQLYVEPSAPAYER